jgi:hypothetical protein
MTIISSLGATKKIKLPKEICNGLQLVYFDNGIGGYWFSPKPKNNQVILCWRGLETFESQEKNVRQLEKLFPNYDIIYIETPGIGISVHVTTPHIIEQLYNVYKNVIRYQRWNKIGFIAFEYGAVLQSELFAECKKQRFRLPDWIIQINGFASMNSIILHKVPSLLQFFFQSKKFISIENYKNTNLPIILFHSKNNTLVPFVDSVQLYFSLRSNPQCKMIPLYGHEEMTLLSKENMEMIAKNISFII